MSKFKDKNGLRNKNQAQNSNGYNGAFNTPPIANSTVMGASMMSNTAPNNTYLNETDHFFNDYNPGPSSQCI